MEDGRKFTVACIENWRNYLKGAVIKNNAGLSAYTDGAEKRAVLRLSYYWKLYANVFSESRMDPENTFAQ